MTEGLILISVILFLCILFQRITGKLGIPGLFIFIVIGMLFGSDGIFKIKFDDYDFAYYFSSIALIFIMFYGGVGTKWSKAKPVAAKAIVLSSLGTILTALFVGVFCFLVLKISILESLLIGSLICSTDAASVFSILRSKKMNLKYSTASLIEVESGSNDPFSYMLTTIILTIMNGGSSSFLSIVAILLIQVLVGVVFGFIFALIAKFILSRINFKESGFDLAFIVAIAIMAYALPTLLQGNGYLAVYICGIVIGNSKVSSKKNMFNFFDGVTSIIQMFLFFLLGLLATPSELPNVALLGFLIALFLTIVARPLAVFISMLFFKAKFRQQIFVAWTGMRGVASIVFAIIAITNPAKIDNDIFHIVFFIVLFSISLQGSLLPLVAKKLDMIDYSDDVMKTFNDYLEEVPVEFLQFSLPNNHEWIGKRICEVIFPPESILVLIIRDNKRIIPNGNTLLNEKDILIMSGKDSRKIEGINLYEKIVDEYDELINKKIKDISIKEKLIILIKRKNNVIIPKGDTVIYAGDILVINDTR